ncbi:MAG: alanine--tRNA ligase [Minisyncoccia bacterium]
MQSNEIRKKFLDFFAKRGHAIIPSASLVPENDPSVLFNTAGMQPLVPYLMGAKHPMGTRIADVQKCVRTGDLDDIGDNRHFSFFEMMGNWSLGDYFKEDAIKWSYEFLTDKTEGLGLDANRLAVTIFEGDESAPLDTESKQIWMSLGIPEDRIYALPADDNFWSPGDNGPCGPCSEMFYDMEEKFVGKVLSKDEFVEQVKAENFIEIWNDVFMEYEKKDGKVVGKLAQKNVDTGAGLERITAVMQGKKTAYETDILSGVIEKIKSESKNYNETYGRIITDHLRTALFMTADGVFPSNKDRGYILRRLIRRATVRSLKLEFSATVVEDILKMLVENYKEVYSNITEEKNIEIIIAEVIKFKKTVEDGLKEFERGVDPFVLATTYGFPIELTEELAKEKGITIDRAKFDAQMKEHQKLSQSASAGMFKGGLANTNEQTIKLHTAHHLVLAALQVVLGKSVKQRGSNITEERLRIDFAFDRKLTDEEKKRVEDLVNGWIAQSLPVIRREMPKTEAEALGAEMEFGAKYPDVVSVYEISASTPTPPPSGHLPLAGQEKLQRGVISLEFCGGPHVTNTSEIGHITIGKEEAVSQGVRRLKATLG